MKAFEVIELPTADKARYVELALHGYLDAHTVSEFEAYMERSIAEGWLRYMIDIAELNYLSSAGIAALISLTQRLRRANGEVVLLRPNKKVFTVLEKLGFTMIFNLARSREEAEKTLGV